MREIIHKGSTKTNFLSNRVFCVVDRFELFHSYWRMKINPKLEAQIIRILVNPLAYHHSLVVFMDPNDENRIKAYTDAGYKIYTTTGYYFDLTNSILNELKNLNPDDHIVVVSSNTMLFSWIYDLFAHKQARISVWSPNDNPDLLKFSRNSTNNIDYRRLNELIPDMFLRNITNAYLWLDIESFPAEWKAMKTALDLKRTIDICRSVTHRYGDIERIIVNGDFHLLERQWGFDVQRELVRLGIDTRYQVNQRKVTGKSIPSEEMQYYLRQDPFGVVVFSSCDQTVSTLFKDLHPIFVNRVIILILNKKLDNKWKNMIQNVIFV